MESGGCQIRVIKDQIIPPHLYSETINDVGLKRMRILKDKLYAHLNAGATMVLNRFELKCQKVSEVAFRIGQYIGEKTIANGYASFGGEGAFGRHWDTHDVFAVQLIGRKRWSIYSPTVELPLPTQTSRDCKELCPSTAILETILERGDVLYIPRGWWHSTECCPEDESFHVAVGVHAPRVIDYATWVCMLVMEKHVSARRSIKWDSQNIDFATFLEKFKREISDIDTLTAFKEASALATRCEVPFFLGQIVEEASNPREICSRLPYRQPSDHRKFYIK